MVISKIFFLSLPTKPHFRNETDGGGGVSKVKLLMSRYKELSIQLSMDNLRSSSSSSSSSSIFYFKMVKHIINLQTGHSKGIHSHKKLIAHIGLKQYC